MFAKDYLMTRDGNGLDLDRVQVDSDLDPFSTTRSRSGPGSAVPVLQDLDPDTADLVPDPGPKWVRLVFAFLFCIFECVEIAIKRYL